MPSIVQQLGTVDMLTFWLEPQLVLLQIWWATTSSKNLFWMHIMRDFYDTGEHEALQESYWKFILWSVFKWTPSILRWEFHFIYVFFDAIFFIFHGSFAFFWLCSVLIWLAFDNAFDMLTVAAYPDLFAAVVVSEGACNSLSAARKSKSIRLHLQIFYHGGSWQMIRAGKGSRLD